MIAKKDTDEAPDGRKSSDRKRPSFKAVLESTLETSQSGNSASVPKPMFADAEAMKEKLRQNMQRPQYDVAKFYYTTGLFQYIARHTYFERMTLAVITMNALYISVDTDLNKSMSLLEAAWPFQISEHFFCVYFTFEWFVRFMSFKRKRDGCRDAWFVFDSCMVVMMVAETWVITLMLVAFGGGGSDALGNAGIMRLLRLLRLSRMARMARLLRAMPELLILIKGMVSAMRSVFFTLLLQVIILYIFGITFKQLSADTLLELRYFETVTISMHSLLLYGTLMDNIGELVTDLGAEGPVYPAVFYVFVLISALTVMNMLIGVLCEVVSAVAATEREELTVSYVKARLREILRQGGLDQDGDGMISKVEFAQILENPAAARILAEVGVDVFGLVELSDFIFEKEDDETGQKTEGQLTFADFMAVVLDLRGSNTATVKDIVDLRKFMSASSKTLENRMKGLEERLGNTLTAYCLAYTPMWPASASKTSCGVQPVQTDASVSQVQSMVDVSALSSLESEKICMDLPVSSAQSCPQAVPSNGCDRPQKPDNQRGVGCSSEPGCAYSVLDPVDEVPAVPCETEAGAGDRRLPDVCNAVHDLRLALSAPEMNQIAESSCILGFDRVCLELDRLRQHVDAELLLIAREIARNSDSLAVVPQLVGNAPACTDFDQKFGMVEDYPDMPKITQSSAMVAMSPGAEMASELNDPLPNAGTNLARRCVGVAAHDQLANGVGARGAPPNAGGSNDTSASAALLPATFELT